MISSRMQLRWYIKKLARVSVALLSWGSGVVALRRWLGREPQVRVLMYHRFRDAPYDPFSVSVTEFTRQMAWLAQQRLAISLDDLQAFLAGDQDVPDGAVLVTVDDGYRDLWTQAVPILQRFDIPAVAFIPTAEVGDLASDGLPDAQRLTWNEVCALPRYGVTVGSHAREHQSLGSLGRDQVYFQADQSRRELEDHLHTPVASFAYPFGTRADYNETTEEVVGNAGYRYTFTAQHGAIQAGAATYGLPRVKVEGGEGLWMFKLLVKGGLDAWGWLDRFLWRWQQSEAG